MFCCRVILLTKERTCCLIQPFHMTRSYESFVKKLHANRIKQYCTSTKDKSKKLEIGNISKMNGSHIKDQIQSNVKNMAKHERFLETDLSKKTDQMNKTDDISESTNTVSHATVHAMYPNPVHTIHGVYQIVKKELNDNSVFNVHYKKLSGQTSYWKCIYSISWPEKIEFTAQAVSKIKASKQAALKCLHWLHLQKRISDNKPIIYSDEEIETKLRKTTPIHLNLTLVEKVKRLLDKYEMHIEDIILHSQINDDKSNDMPVSKDFVFKRPSSLLYSIRRNKELQDRLLLNNVNKKNGFPIYEYRDEILQKLENNQTIVIRGDTGCGKSTQVPQFIMDSFIRKGNATDCNILISEPRRISAISLAQRVTFERGETVGDVVGYKVRLEEKLPQFPGAMLFCTTGILRQLIQANPNLIGYSHVILDEAHDRSLDIDVLLVLLKRALQNNPTLKLIVMSATLNINLFQKYYNCTTINVPGKIYPVKMHFMEDFQHLLPDLKKEENTDDNENILRVNCDDIANLIRWILEKKPPGTILCFLPGWLEITKVTDLLKSINSREQKVLIIPLHSKLSNINQHKIFEPAPPNITKVILATDIAETGITVPDVIYVIDSAIRNGLVWDEKKFSPRMSYLKVSQASILQRKGRAGRTQSGESYHFIREKEYDSLEPYQVPEILRCSLEKTVVDIKTYTNEKVAQFCGSMLQPPNSRTLDKAVNTLKELNIIDKYENLTPLGKLVACIPVHPTLGKALILSTVFECFQPILNITTLYSLEGDIFSNILYNKTLKRDNKLQFHKTSDFLAMAMLFEEWGRICKESDYERSIFCNEMNISPFKINLATKVKKAFIKYLKDCNLLENESDSYDLETLPNKYASYEEIIHGIILSSTNKLLQHFEFSYIKGVFRKKPQILTENNERADISNESVNHRQKSLPSPFFIYLDGMHLHNRPAMKINDTSIISPLATLLFSQGEKYYKLNGSGNSGNIIVKTGKRKKLFLSCNAGEAHLLLSFHDVIWSVVDYFIRQKFSNTESITELNCMQEYKSEILDVLSQMLSTHDTDEKK